MSAGEAMAVRSFRSRVDWWLLAPILALLGSPGVNALRSPAMDPDDRWLALLVSGATVGLIVWLAATTRYVLEPEHLALKTGPFASRVPYARLTRVERSRSPLSAPAWSLRRLMLHYGVADFALVSPADEAGFLHELAARAPQATLPDIR